MKLCSVIMPTRSGTHDMLRKAVRSILDAPGTNKDDVEILLRVDDDDPTRFFVAEELTKGVGSFKVGPRFNGYNSMGIFARELVDLADSTWCWLVDDDAWIDGAWYPQLKSLTSDINPNHGFNTQYYMLGNSLYENGKVGGCVGIGIPTALAKTIEPVSPIDQAWLGTMMNMGWHLKLMQGTTLRHCGRAR
jgi:hypothetical protein